MQGLCEDVSRIMKSSVIQWHSGDFDDNTETSLTHTLIYILYILYVWNLQLN